MAAYNPAEAVSEIAAQSHATSSAFLRRVVRDSIHGNAVVRTFGKVYGISESVRARVHILFFINSRLFDVTQHMVGTHSAHRAHKQTSSSGDCSRRWGNFVLEARQGHYYVG